MRLFVALALLSLVNASSIRGGDEKDSQRVLVPVPTPPACCRFEIICTPSGPSGPAAKAKAKADGNGEAKAKAKAKANGKEEECVQVCVEFCAPPAPAPAPVPAPTRKA